MLVQVYSLYTCYINLDDYMFLNQGKFRQNGGCGYILKPKVMRNLSSDGMLVIHDTKGP